MGRRLVEHGDPAQALLAVLDRAPVDIEALATAILRLETDDLILLAADLRRAAVRDKKPRLAAIASAMMSVVGRRWKRDEVHDAEEGE